MPSLKRIEQEEERENFWAALLIVALILIAWGVVRYKALSNMLSLTLQHSQATGSLETSGTLEPY